MSQFEFLCFYICILLKIHNFSFGVIFWWTKKSFCFWKSFFCEICCMTKKVVWWTSFLLKKKFFFLKKKFFSEKKKLIEWEEKKCRYKVFLVKKVLRWYLKKKMCENFFLEKKVFGLKLCCEKSLLVNSYFLKFVCFHKNHFGYLLFWFVLE